MQEEISKFTVCKYYQNLLGTTDFDVYNCCLYEYHIQIYLTHLLETNKNIEKEELKQYLTSKWPKVRHLAVRIYQKQFDDEYLDQFRCDPFYRVRLLAIQNCNLDNLLKSVEDENIAVKIAALKEIEKRELDNDEIINVLCSVGKCIVHRDMSVRKVTARLLRIFVGLKPETLEMMLSKKDEDVKTKNLCGLIIYGLEDEFSEVRKSTIESLYYLSNDSTVSKTFESFIDSLNDESIDVRRTTSDCIRKLLMNYKLIVDLESTKQICFLLKEEDGEIRDNIVQIISKLGYKDIECIIEIIEGICLGLSRRDIMKILLCIFRNNTELVFNNIDRFYKYSPFVEHQIVLSDTKYFCRLLLISFCTFNNFKIKLDRNTKRHIRYVIQEMSTSTNFELVNLKDLTKDLIVKYIEDKDSRNRIDELLKKRTKMPDFFKFAKRLIKYLKKEEDKLILIKLNYLYSNLNFTKEIVEDIEKLVEFIYDLDFEYIKRTDNNIFITNEPIIKEGQVVDFEFQIDSPFKEAKLVLEDDRRRIMRFNSEKYLKTSFLNDGIKFLKYYLEIKEVDRSFVISKLYTFSL